MPYSEVNLKFNQTFVLCSRRLGRERALGFHKCWSKFKTIFYFSFRRSVAIPSYGCYSFSFPGRNRRKRIQKRRWTVMQREFLMDLVTWPLNDNEAEVALSYLAFQSIEELYIHPKNGKGLLLATAISYLFDVRGVRYVKNVSVHVYGNVFPVIPIKE